MAKKGPKKKPVKPRPTNVRKPTGKGGGKRSAKKAAAKRATPAAARARSVSFAAAAGGTHYTPAQVRAKVLEIARALDPTATLDTQLGVLPRRTFVININAGFGIQLNPDDYADTDTVRDVLVDVLRALRSQGRLDE